jgi:hypothetical protein
MLVPSFSVSNSINKFKCAETEEGLIIQRPVVASSTGALLSTQRPLTQKRKRVLRWMMIMRKKVFRLERQMITRVKKK